MIPKPDFCKKCPINHCTVGYAPLKLRPGNTLVVGEANGKEEVKTGEGFSGGAGMWLKNLFKTSGQSWNNISTLNVIGCQPPDNVWPGDQDWRHTTHEAAVAAVEYCKEHHMWPGIRQANRSRIIACGAKALEALTGKVGINRWRGSALPLIGGSKPQVMPTIHPAALMRQAKLLAVVAGDLKKPLALPPENYNLAPTLEDVRLFDATTFAFDLEWDALGNPTHCGLSDKFYWAMVVPFKQPYLQELRRIFENAKVLIGHNIIHADLPYIEKMKWNFDLSKIEIQDTMLKQHLVQPDFPHSLAFVASVFTDKVFWKGHGWEVEDADGEVTPGGQQWRTWDKPEGIARELGGYKGCLSPSEAFSLYNARDTDAEFQINTPLDHQLLKYGVGHVYRHVSLPVAFICRSIGERGLKIDTSQLGQIRKEVDATIEALEDKLPAGLRPFDQPVSCNVPAPEGTFRRIRKVCGHTARRSRRARSTVPQQSGTVVDQVPVGLQPPFIHIFTAPGSVPCPTCGNTLSSGKMVPAKVIKGTKLKRVVPYNSPQAIQKYVDGLALPEVLNSKTKRKTTGKRARKIWAKDHPEFATLGALKEQVTLKTNFAKDSLLTEPRMMFNLKVTGTSEGRLSSVGQRKGVDLNIQNQPASFRKIYVPDKPGWSFINLDIVQGENWLTAWIAKDWNRWERLQQPGYDEHAELASRIFNKSVTKEATKASHWKKLHRDWTDKQCEAEALHFDALRQIGKKIGHGRNYGMGVKKQLEELVQAGYEMYTEADVKEFIAIWRSMNARTSEWQGETIALASQQGYLRNAFGRARWFTSRSIATECLAFLPASTLADTVLRMMIAHYPDNPLIYPSIVANNLEVYEPLVPEWVMSIQVHDSLVHQGPDEGWREQASRSKRIMEQPWKELDGFHFLVEAKYSPKSWGEVKTVTIN